MLEPLDRAHGEMIARKARDCLTERSIDRAQGERLTKYVVIQEDELATLAAWAERGLAAETRK